MSVNRLILLALILGGLTLFLVQNWSVFPVLSITLLGIKTRTLPLAAWILFSLLAGAGTSVLINSLLQLSGYFSRGGYSQQSSVPKNSRRKYGNTDFREERGSRSSASPPKAEPEFYNRREYRNYTDNQESRDDWESPINADDWGFKEDNSNPQTRNYTDTTTSKNNTSETKKNKRTYSNEREWETETPKTPRSDSDSSYSSEASQPNQTPTTKSVYDADYRVIVPPNESFQASQDDIKSNKSEDDWGFLEEDDFEIDKNRD